MRYCAGDFIHRLLFCDCSIDVHCAGATRVRQGPRGDLIRRQGARRGGHEVSESTRPGATRPEHSLPGMLSSIDAIRYTNARFSRPTTPRLRTTTRMPMSAPMSASPHRKLPLVPPARPVTAHRHPLNSSGWSASGPAPSASQVNYPCLQFRRSHRSSLLLLAKLSNMTTTNLHLARGRGKGVGGKRV